MLQNPVSVYRLALLYLTGILNTPIGPSFDLRHIYAILRYWWAFDTPGTHLLLDQGVVDIDRHQKTLMSDEIGAGFAGLAMLAMGCTHYAEVDRLVRAGRARFRSRHKYDQPDYVGLNKNERILVVCEAKGSQSSMATHNYQLSRGQVQVANLVYSVSGYARKDIVSGVLLGNHSSNASVRRTMWTVVDPPSLKKDHGEWEDDAATIVNFHYGSLLRFVGAEKLAVGIESGDVGEMPDLDLPVVGKMDGRIFKGRELAAGLFRPGDRRSFQVGVSEEVMRSWLSGGPREKASVPKPSVDEEGYRVSFPDGGYLGFSQR